MDASMLTMLFGPEPRWSGPCTVIVDAYANIQAIGADAIVQGGIKAFSPRLITGRLQADNSLYMSKQQAIVLIRKTVTRAGGGPDQVTHNVHVVDISHVVAIEFDHLDAISKLGLSAP
jgi:hypothetical protein